MQLVYQDWRTDWFPLMAQQSLQKFHATHPNIRVFYTPDPENVEESMLTDMQAGDGKRQYQAQRARCLVVRRRRHDDSFWRPKTRGCV